MRIRLDLKQLEKFNVETASLAKVNSRLVELKKLWEGFQSEHQKFAQVCTSSLLKHSYMKSSTFEKTYENCNQAWEYLQDLHHQVDRSYEASRQPPPTTARASSISLPKVNLPTFDGNYMNWQTYRDLFSSLIIQNASLTNVERMHYLESTLKSEAASVTLNLSVEADAFTDAWATLVKRYENKRLLMSIHLEKLTSLRNGSRTSQSLNSITLKVNQSLDALRHLKNGKCILDYLQSTQP